MNTVVGVMGKTNCLGIFDKQSEKQMRALNSSKFEHLRVEYENWKIKDRGPSRLDGGGGPGRGGGGGVGVRGWGIPFIETKKISFNCLSFLN